MPAVSGSPTQVASSVSTLQDLAGVPDDAFKSGDLAFVESLQPNGHFELVRSSGAAPSGAIPTFSGNGYWLPLPSNMVSVPDITALEAYPDAGLQSGAIAYVETVRSYWQKLVAPSVPATNGISVASTNSGTGVWIRLDNVASPSWATERVVNNAVTWYIDPANGDDENDGSTSAAGGAGAGYVGALQTVAELARRLLYLQRGVTYTVQLLGDVPSTDSFNFTGRILVGNGLATTTTVGFIGTETATPSADDLTALTQTDGAAATQASCTDVNRAWTVPTNALPVPDLIRYLNAGTYNYAFVIKNLGLGVARLGHIFVPSTASPFGTPAIASSVPATPVAYEMVVLSEWNAPVAIDGPFRVSFRSLNFASLESGRFTVGTATLTHTLCVMCRVSYSSPPPPATPTAIYAAATRTGVGATTITYDGCFLGCNDANTSFSASNPGGRISCSLTTFMGINIQINNTALTQAWAVTSCTFQGGIAGANRNARILAASQGGPSTGGCSFVLSGIVSFFDWQQAGGAIEMNNGAQLVGTGLTALFGSQDPAYAGYGVRVRGGSRMILPSALSPKLNSNGGGGGYDIDLDGLNGADGTATAVLQRPLPGALWSATPATNGYSVSLLGANGAGWTAWAAARATPGLERYAVGHVTGATLVGV